MKSLSDKAKAQAAVRGKSLSGMFSEIVQTLDSQTTSPGLPPITNSLLGVMKNHPLSEEDHKEHLRKKHA